MDDGPDTGISVTPAGSPQKNTKSDSAGSTKYDEKPKQTRPQRIRVRASAGARDMRFYYVDKRDMALIGQASFRAAVYFGVAAFFLSFSLDLTVAIALTSGPLTPEGVILSTYGRPAALLIAIAFLILAAHTVLSRAAWWRLLREEHGEEVDIWGKERPEQTADESSNS